MSAARILHIATPDTGSNVMLYLGSQKAAAALERELNALFSEHRIDCVVGRFSRPETAAVVHEFNFNKRDREAMDLIHSAAKALRSKP